MLNISICENLKELRREKGNTQEDLAEFLGITISAISKWERSEGFPDITLLPKIAAYYDVSVDDLLGVGEIRKKERLDEYEKECRRVGSSNPEGQLAVWREAQKDFPNDFTVMRNLVHCLFILFTDNKDKKFADEITALGEKILAKSTDNNARYSAIQILCFTYGLSGEKEKAQEYAKMAPSYWVTSDELISHIYKKEEAFPYYKCNVANLFDLMTVHISNISNVLEGDERKQVLYKRLSCWK